MSDWTWKVPTVYGTRWDDRSQNTVDRSGSPFVDVYCEGSSASPHPLYLVGSFSPSVAVWEQKQQVWWSFEPRYIAGDGTVIELHQRARRDRRRDGRETNDVSVSLIGDRKLTTAAERNAADQSQIRGVFVLKCETCGLECSIRSDNPMVPKFAATLHTLGRREVSLSGVIGRFVE